MDITTVIHRVPPDTTTGLDQDIMFERRMIEKTRYATPY
jgi:hypothetical protein